MFDGRWKTQIERGLVPVGAGLRRAGVTADVLTGTGLVLAVAAAVAVGSGALRLGLALVILAALPDLLDGAVAKASGSAGPRGAFFDSVADRVTDALLLGGIAWYLADVRSPHTALLPMAVLAASSVISYERAKAESLGFQAKGGLMERAERIIVLCIALATGSASVMVAVLWVMLVLTVITAVQRFAKVWVQASAVRTERPERASARRRARRLSRPATSDRTWRRSGRRRPPRA